MPCSSITFKQVELHVAHKDKLDQHRLPLSTPQELTITSTSLFHRRHKKDKKDKKKLADKAAATVAAAKGREEEDERGDALSKE